MPVAYAAMTMTMPVGAMSAIAWCDEDAWAEAAMSAMAVTVAAVMSRFCIKLTIG